MKVTLVTLFTCIISFSLSAQSLGSWGKYSLTGTAEKKTATFDYVVNPILIEKSSSNTYWVGDDINTVKVKFEFRNDKIYISYIINEGSEFFDSTKPSAKNEGVKPKFKDDFKSVLEVYHGLFKEDIKQWKSKGFWNDNNTKKTGYGMEFQKGRLILIGHIKDGLFYDKVYLFSNEGMAGEFDFANGEPNGQAIQYLKSGMVVTGKYVNNLKDGPFTYKYANGKSEIINYKNNQRIWGETNYSSKAAAEKKSDNYYGMSDSIITQYSNFDSDIDYLKKHYTKKGILIAGPYSGSHSEHSYELPLVGAYCSSELKSNKSYVLMIVKDKKKNPCKELIVKVKYGNPRIKVPPSETLMPEESENKTGNSVSEKYHIYYTSFGTGDDFENIRILAYSRCKWTQNARIFILKKN